MAKKPAPSDDSVFRYPLLLEPDGNAVYQDSLTELIRSQLVNILNLAVPVANNKELKIDRFKLLRDREAIYRIFSRKAEKGRAESTDDRAGHPPKTSSQDIKNAALYEPRIEFIKAQLESLLRVVDLEKGGNAIVVDGFRLKNLKDWLVPSACDPVEVFGYAGARCNADCIFCYNRGNPPSLALDVLRRPATEEWQEMMTRLKYFSPGAGQCLFPSMGSIYEVLVHPKILTVLRKLREKTPAVFRIATNGTLLTPGRISQLAALQPIYLYLSLNSASPSRRHKLMKDSSPRVAINAPPLLRKNSIPYATVIVPWPFDSLAEMLEDLTSTVAYADQHDSHIIQVNLPGYSKYFSSEKLYDLDGIWSATITRVRELREKTSTPIVVMPGIAEKNYYEERKNRSKIVGLVKNSPAARAGLRKGDEILELSGLTAGSRPQARHLLAMIQESKVAAAKVTIMREGRSLDLSVNLLDFSYPYSESTDRHMGIVMMGTGFQPGYLEKLRGIIDNYKAKRVLFLSSTLVRPSFEQALAESPLFASGEVEIDIQVPGNNFFGGNIFMGDLLVVQDFIDFIKEHLEKGRKKPDLIVIPSSPFNLGSWRRDLTGRVYLDIEREVGIPVELLDCETIYD